MRKQLRKLASGAMWSACRLLPVQNNKVVFCSAGGRGFGDNPKAVALALMEQQPGLDLVWLTKDVKIELPAGVRPCPYGTPQAVRELSTAKVWVNDSRGGAHFKRKNQRYLQTWHGFALKHIERQAVNLPEHYVEQCKKDSEMIDLIVSNSAFMTKVYREDFWYDGEIREFGSPRNDILFHANDCGGKVKGFFGLEQDCNLLLYAPTFRDDGSTECYAIDPAAALAACEKRFGGQWAALLRLHPNAAALSKGLFPYDGKRILDATSYPDMQELLIACDLLITDYSSSMFDYALSGKPCIQFATDVEAYQKGRGFYFPLDGLPFPMARSNEELCGIIAEFDEAAQQKRWSAFTEENGFCEDGHAAQRCAQWILDQMKEKTK